MLLGFKSRFVDAILKGTKVHTMRHQRKHEPKEGDTLHMYTGLRTSNCRKITSKEKFMGKQLVGFLIKRYVSGKKTAYKITISVDGRKLSNKEINQFVQFDGFTDREDFANYWLEETAKQHKKRKGTVNYIRGKINLYHWTDLKY